MNPIKNIKATACPIVGDNIDTDQIIPARYLTAISFDKIEEGLFYDLRFDKEDKSLNFALDDEKHTGHKIYISGENFGCGSSREHAPQAIKRSGVDIVIAQSFSEIFFGNSIALGLICLTLDKQPLAKLTKFVQDNPSQPLTVNVEDLTITYDGKTITAQLDKEIQELFVKGTYDPLQVLLSHQDKIVEFEKTLPRF